MKAVRLAHGEDAEELDSAGAQINVVTRTGTNQFHGSAFEYLRNSELDAASFFSKAGGITTKPPFKQNQFGATLGGAILKNSTFFFFSYEGTRIRQALTRTSTVPSAAMRAGDFSGLATIYDPLNVVDGLRRPFPGNGIPDSRISAASRALQAYVPLPNAPGTATLHSERSVQGRDQPNRDSNQPEGEIRRPALWTFPLIIVKSWARAFSELRPSGAAAFRAA